MRTSQAEQETACLHPDIEEAMLTWLKHRLSPDKKVLPAFLLIGSPGVGKTTMVYRVCKAAKYWIQEFNASHTRTGSSFRQTILPLLTEPGISALIHPSTPNGRAILLDEMDGLSQGEKGGLQELLDYLKSKKPPKEDGMAKEMDAPLFLICNVMEGRVMQQLLKYCCVKYVSMPKKEALDSFYKQPISESLYRLGDIRKVSQGLLCDSTKNAYEQNKQDDLDKNIHVAIRAAWYTLFEQWGLSDELDLETKDANLAGLLFHQNLPLFLEKAPHELYEQILEYIRWSDRADFWAFFHQCWNLLPLSYHLKLKYPNHILQAYPKPDKIPELHELVYTQVLTKQSALFNSWKEMNRVSNDMGVPFRCITQWATYQTGKLKETLGLPVCPVLHTGHTRPEGAGIVSISSVTEPQPKSVLSLRTIISSTKTTSAVLETNEIVVPVAAPSVSTSVVSHGTAGQRKKSKKTPV
jgi:DNA polymerase III delta prime subunit